MADFPIIHHIAPFGDPNAEPGDVLGSSFTPATPGVQGHHGTVARGFIAGQNPFADQQLGVYGESSDLGVFGFAKTSQGTGVAGNSASGMGIGVHGHTSTNVGVLGSCDGTGLAGKFIGNVEVDGGNLTLNGGGNLTINNGGDIILADCAEDFQLASDRIEAVPGSVMVLDATGAIRPCSEPYDKCVVGVVSGAGPYRPAIVFDRTETSNGRVPLSLVGKVCCMVDATFGAIKVGDLLTTSSTPGHAMKADDAIKAFGSVIGKALQAHDSGCGLIPVLVALQ